MVPESPATMGKRKLVTTKSILVQLAYIIIVVKTSLVLGQTNCFESDMRLLPL